MNSVAANRAMLLTAPGPGAIAVVRLAGKGVRGFLRDHFSRDAAGGVMHILGQSDPGPPPQPSLGVPGEGEKIVKPRMCIAPAAGRPVHGVLWDGGEAIDDCVVFLHGDRDVVDVNVHGSPWIARRVLDLARREGFE